MSSISTSLRSREIDRLVGAVCSGEPGLDKGSGICLGLSLNVAENARGGEEAIGAAVSGTGLVRAADCAGGAGSGTASSSDSSRMITPFSSRYSGGGAADLCMVVRRGTDLVINAPLDRLKVAEGLEVGGDASSSVLSRSSMTSGERPENSI